MGEKDIAEKLLEDNNDVFADIANVLLFDGEEIINSESLEKAQERSAYTADKGFREQERDTAKYWKNGNVTISFLGIGNQSSVDRDSALRVIGYDGAAYRAQLYTEKDEKGNYLRNKNPRYPVIALILYFGNGNWTAPKNLRDCLNIPNGLEKYVSDYSINVFEIRKLSREQVDKFKSDFWIVADYFYQVEHNKDYVPSTKKMKHVEEVMQLLSALTNDNSYEIAFHEANQEGNGDSMDPIVEKIENRGLEKGIKGTIDILLELKIPYNDIESKLMSTYNLDRETADRYVKECTKV